MAGDRMHAVRRLARELASEPVPELDWDRIEKNVLNAALQREDATPHRVPIAWVWAGAGAIALAAAVATLVWTARTRPHAAPVAVAGSAAPASLLDGDSLGLGAAVEATGRPITVDHRGQASWTLEPHSRAHIVERGALLTIALDSGAVDVHVVPHSGGEPFAVEAGLTRVAAHGTRFRVERVTDGVHVDVSEGIVAVGETSDRGHTHGFTLPAPSRGAFGLDGATGTVWSASGAASVGDHVFAARGPAPDARQHAAWARKRTPVPSASIAPVVVPPPATASAPRTLERVPTIAEIDDGLAAFQTAANQCFANRAPASGVTMTVGVTAFIDIAPSGKINSVDFAPPLAPEDQRCVEARLSSVTFAESRDGVKIERTLEFNH